MYCKITVFIHISFGTLCSFTFVIVSGGEVFLVAFFLLMELVGLNKTLYSRLKTTLGIEPKAYLLTTVKIVLGRSYEEEFWK